MKKFLLVFFTIFINAAIYAQFTIYGSVTDSEGSVIPYIKIAIENTDHITRSDENGRYSLENIPAGRYTILVYAMGYKDYEYDLMLLENSNLDIVIDRKSVKLREIFISGNRVDERMPFTYKNISKDFLKSKNFTQDIPFLLELTPSFVATSDGGTGTGYTWYRIRGTDPTRINVTINNIPINDSESQLVYWVNMPDLAGSAESIQVQRGVGTSTNGAGAFGASINLLTNQINYDPYITLDGSYGSFNTKKISAKAGTGLMNDKYSINMRYSLIGSDGYIDRADASLNSFFISAASLGKSSSLRFNALMGKERTYQAWDGVPVQYAFTDSLRTFNVQGTDYFRHNPPYENQIDDYTQNHFQLFYNKDMNEKIVLNTGIHYTRGYGFYEQYKVNQRLINYNIDTSVVQRSDLVRQKWLSNHFFGIVYNLKYENLSTSLIFGGAANRYIGDHFGVVNAILKLPEYREEGRYYDNRGLKNEFNSYAKVLHSFTPGFSGFLDLQYRFVNYSIAGDDDNGLNYDLEDTRHFFNPKMGFNIKINKNISAYSSFAMAGKEPNRVDYTAAPAGQLPRPETLYDLETGVRFNSRNFAAQANFYHMNYKDQLILNGKINHVGKPIRENVSNSYRMGLELEAATKIREFMRFDGNITLSRNKIKEYTEIVPVWDAPFIPEEIIYRNTTIGYSPSIIGGAGLTFDILKLTNPKSTDNFSAGFFVKYVGKQYLDNTQNETASLKAYNFTDFNIAYKLNIRGANEAELSFRLGNLFNQSYISNGYAGLFRSEGYNPLPDDLFTIRSSSNYYYYMGLFPQATRNFTLRLRVHFE
jgi:iron complex outermembrane receptor protein